MLKWSLRSLACCVAGACLSVAVESQGQPNTTVHDGRFELVTYNVAGLPEGLSAVHPMRNLPLIGSKLNRFDVVLVQEDYAYPHLLRQGLQLPYRSRAFERGEALHFGDGLSQFSKFPLTEEKRAAWSSCHGVVDSFFDCLTPKGFSFSRVELSPGVLLDLYNVHFDAGWSAGDVQARGGQLRQLLASIRDTSQGRALIVGGDFNLTAGELGPFREALRALGLVDACDALRCGQSRRLDRVLYRRDARLRLEARTWRLGKAFRDAQGRALSDHAPVVVQFAWTR